MMEQQKKLLGNVVDPDDGLPLRCHHKPASIEHTEDEQDISEQEVSS